MSFSFLNSNVVLLTACRALGMSAIVMITLVGGLIGTDLAPQAAWSTLPNSVGIIGVGLGAAPAALWMQRIGRRGGFVSGALLGALAAALGGVAVWRGDFLLFCLSFFLLGASAAFVHQYRFAAAESVAPADAGKAVATVLLGTVVAAWLGPELAARTRTLLPWGEYSGSFAALAAMLVASSLLLTRYRPAQRSAPDPDRPGIAPPAGTRALVATGMLAGVTAYGVMVLIMTATPISMHLHDHYSVNATAWVIQSHVMAMYLPSLVAGAIVARFGTVRVMLAGVAAIGACIAVAIAGRSMAHYWSALVLLGLGWNLLFVSGTTLVSLAAQGPARYRVQALNEFLTFGVAALGSLLGGALVHSAGWITVNLVGLPLLAVMVAALALAHRARLASVPSP